MISFNIDKLAGLTWPSAHAIRTMRHTPVKP